MLLLCAHKSEKETFYKLPKTEENTEKYNLNQIKVIEIPSLWNLEGNFKVEYLNALQDRVVKRLNLQVQRCFKSSLALHKHWKQEEMINLTASREVGLTENMQLETKING